MITVGSFAVSDEAVETKKFHKVLILNLNYKNASEVTKQYVNATFTYAFVA